MFAAVFTNIKQGNTSTSVRQKAIIEIHEKALLIFIWKGFYQRRTDG